MLRSLALAYGVAAYLVFFGTILYAIGFVTGLVVPKAMNDGIAGPIRDAIGINVALLALFAVQHSAMARQSFKRWWTQVVPAPIERSTYVLLSSLALLLLFWQWRPIPAVVWNIIEPTLAMALLVLSLIGWCIVFLSTFMISHFELLGLTQVWHNLVRRSAVEPRFKTPMLYKLVRHPIYLGFLIAFWATPVMTMGHLLFAAGTTAYIFVGIALEERDLIAVFGSEYRRYRQQVGMILPRMWPPSRTETMPGKRRDHL